MSCNLGTPLLLQRGSLVPRSSANGQTKRPSSTASMTSQEAILRRGAALLPTKPSPLLALDRPRSSSRPRRARVPKSHRPGGGLLLSLQHLLNVFLAHRGLHKDMLLLMPSIACPLMAEEHHFPPATARAALGLHADWMPSWSAAAQTLPRFSRAPQ